MAAGWMIGVMVRPAGEPRHLRHFFAVGHDDRAKAEWTAIDKAMLLGEVAESPIGGLEPVHMISELTPANAASLALKPAEVRSLGWKWPRRWLSL
jgi:hypothetical protein